MKSENGSIGAVIEDSRFSGDEKRMKSEDGGNGSFEMIGKPVTSGVKTVQKARSKAGVFIYGVTESQSNGVARTRWVYPSDTDYTEILGEWEGRQQ